MPRHAEKFRHAGYIHKKKKLLKDGTLLLHCAFRERDGCPAVVHLTNGVFKYKENHDHTPNIDETEASEIRENLKMAAAADNPPSVHDLIKEARESASCPEVVYALGTTESLRQVIKRVQRRDMDEIDAKRRRTRGSMS